MKIIIGKTVLHARDVKQFLSLGDEWKLFSVANVDEIRGKEIDNVIVAAELTEEWFLNLKIAWRHPGVAFVLKTKEDFFGEYSANAFGHGEAELEPVEYESLPPDVWVIPEKLLDKIKLIEFKDET